MQEFKLPNDVQSLFAVEILQDHPKAKDHMAVSQGEKYFVLLINHPKLPDDRYFVEKEDGTSELSSGAARVCDFHHIFIVFSTVGYVKKSISQRVSSVRVCLYTVYIHALYIILCGTTMILLYKHTHTIQTDGLQNCSEVCLHTYCINHAVEPQ